MEERRRNMKTKLRKGVLLDLIIKAIKKYVLIKQQENDDNSEVITLKLDVVPILTEEILEGLIMSYEPTNVKDIIVRKFGLDETQFQIMEMNGAKVCCVFLPLKASKDDKSNIINTMKACGYFMSGKESVSGVYKCLVLTFEPKYQDNVSFDVVHNYKYLYHTTPTRNLKHILKNGLIPKSNNSIFQYNDRIFLIPSNDEIPSNDLISFFKTIRSNKNFYAKVNADEKPFVIDDDYSIIRIKTDNLQKDIKFFNDPFKKDSVYTEDNISPNIIEVVRKL